MKWYLPAFCLAVFSATIGAQEADPCAGLVGAALGQCQGDQQKLQRQQLAQQQQQLAQQQQQLTQQQQQLAQQQQQLMRQQQQLQQQLDAQNQLNQQQPQNQQQLEGMQRKIEILSKQLEHEKSANQPVQRLELKSWKADNPWFGSDYSRTQFAMRYAKQLQQERPDLAGRPFLDAISAKVTDKFGASK
ncbi:MAG TPA: hypothetical protein VHY75_17095 [Steroidobacteraceae bacterium]|jgi:DNA repair exonuclease SbcCD ATPase subunit|nr:hypothetical protein [Steroidobacteraceae bacterium]